MHRVSLRKLVKLNAVTALDVLRMPLGNRLEKLKSDRPRQYSIRVNDQGRVCFRWKDGAPQDVAIVDYHD